MFEKIRNKSESKDMLKKKRKKKGKSNVYTSVDLLIYCFLFLVSIIVLDDRIDYIADVIAEHYKLEDGFSNPTRTTQETITAVGRICCDATDGKINSKSVMLETSRSLGMGKRILLDISDIKDYTLFPGQVNNKSNDNLYIYERCIEFFSFFHFLTIIDCCRSRC